MTLVQRRRRDFLQCHANPTTITGTLMVSATPMKEIDLVLIKETIAMVLIGDAVLGLARPRRHVARWQIGPLAPAMAWARQRPALTRALAGAELAAALWYVGRLPARPTA